MPSSDRAFTGSIPETYQTYLVPLIFEWYAEDLAARARDASPARVLEIAAGTGVVTRALARSLPEGVEVVATDLNPAMLEFAQRTPINRPVEWRQADAMQLPFDARTFDVVVCQFGAMFFPDRPAAFAEVCRVLRPGGRFVFSVWDRLEENPFAAAVHDGVSSMFPDDPPTFLARVPYAYYETARIAADVAASGFDRSARIETVQAPSRADSPRVPAIGFCQGCPLKVEIEARDPSALNRATDAAAEELARRFGHGAIDAAIQAHVVTVVS
jgi:SAM-dependent methyltransferase